MSSYSELIGNLSEAATMVVSEKARQLKRAGVDVVDLGGGDPDFTTPAHIIEAASRAMSNGMTHYVTSKGIPELREAIAEKLWRDNGVKCDPNTELVVTTGARMAIYATLASLCNPGDEVLILEPAWVSYRAIVHLAGATSVPVSLDVADNFLITERILRASITPRTRAIIVNSPGNPTGRVLTMEEWRAIAAAVKGTNIVIISDEVYEKLVYGGCKHISGATVPGLERNVVTVNGFSKTYAMCGWRIGYVVGDKELMSLVSKVQQQVSTCAPSFAQYAGLAALQGPQDCVEEMRQVYEKRRDDLVAGLNAIPGIDCPKPEGAFYVFARFTGIGNMNSWQLADVALDKVAVAAVPGVAFGESGEGCLRMTFAASTEALKKVPERMTKLLREM